jgi:hypothetical protein
MGSANTLPGYTVLKSAAKQLAERDNNIPSTFEVFDLKTFQRTEVDNTPKVVKKGKRIVKPKNIIDVAQEVKEQEEALKKEVVQEETVAVNSQQEVVPQSSVPVVFVTPYTEVEILASEVFVNETVFSIISPQEDRVRIKPKRGAKLDAIYNGETYRLYASGVYIPVNALNSVLSIFFVMDENTEEV